MCIPIVCMQISVTPVMEFEGAATNFLSLPILHIFVVFSECINFMTLAEFGMKQQNYPIVFVNLNCKVSMKWNFIYEKHFNWTF